MRKSLRAAALAAMAVALAVPAVADPQTDCNSILACMFRARHRHAPPQSPAPQPQASIQPAEVQPASIKPTVYNPERKPDGTPILVGVSQRELVDWSEDKYQAGTIIVKTPERALYYVLGDGKALKYGVGVGKEGFQWHGESIVAAKAEWPGWTPPPEMIAREKKNGHIIPAHMDGGPMNPLGARALYLGGRIYRIHGTNNEASIGGDVSSGCIRMMNADIIDLYDRAKIGTKVIVIQ